MNEGPRSSARPALDQIPRRHHLEGTISSAGFAGGHRFVVGHWPVAPVGPMADVMWATPDDERILLAPDDTTADYITAIYEFDDVRIGPLSVSSDERQTTVAGHGLHVHLVGGRRRPLPIRRPLAVTRYLERPIARTLMGVETFGASPTGAREWYQATGWRWVTSGRATLDGKELGPPAPITRSIDVGFSEPPRRPAIVSVRVIVDLRRVLIPGRRRVSA